MLKWVEQTAPVSRCASPLGSLGRSHSPRGSNPSSVGLGTVVSFTGVWAEELCPCLDRLPLRPSMACALTGYLAEPMRRFLPFLMASAILLAGLALAGFEIVRADGVRPFVLFGALVMVVISGAWLLEEFVLPRWRS